MAELLGKATGCSKGKGGSMHFFDAEKGFLGGHAIVGSHIPLAAGVAFAIKYRGEDRVCICYFGDGAMNQGSLHEAFNMATPLEAAGHLRRREQHDVDGDPAPPALLASRDLTVRGGTAYGIPGVSIDGNDIELMARTTREAADRARAGEGPTFIEAKTYRFRGHSMSDPAKYRTKEELDKAKERDPIVALRDRPEGARLDRRRDDRADARERSSRGRRGDRVRRAERPSRRSRRSTGHHRGPVHPAGVIHGRHCITARPRTRRCPRRWSATTASSSWARRSPSTTAPTRSARGCSTGSARAGSSTRRSPRTGSAGIGIGAAMVGLRPIIEFMTFSFSLVAIDQIVNNAANMRYMSGGQFAVPIVFRGNSGMAGCLAATHSHRLEAWYAHIPGLTVVMPATPADAKGLLKSAIRSDDPVIFIEHENLYGDKGEVPEGEHLVPIGKAEIKRPGADVTLITYSRSLKTTLAAAEKLAEEGIDAEVIDLRTIRPLDLDTLLELGRQDPPRRDRRGRLALLRPRRRDLRPDHPGGLRRARRPDPPRRRQGRPDPLQPGPRGLDAPERRADRGRGQRRALSLTRAAAGRALCQWGIAHRSSRWAVPALQRSGARRRP